MSFMWMAELAQRSDLPVATIKFYLREGVLHAGESAGATRAHYNESHVRRLRLVRALVDVAGLSLEAVRDVLHAVDDEHLTWHEAIGSAHSRLSTVTSAGPTTEGRARVDALLAGWGWKIAPTNPHAVSLAHALRALDGLDHHLSDDALTSYAEAMRAIAELEVAGTPANRREDAVEHAVIGTLLVEPVLLALRRLAHADLSQRRFGRRKGRRGPR